MQENESTSLTAEPERGSAALPAMLPGDQLIVGIWIAVAVVLGRAVLQAVVDSTIDLERGPLLIEHFVEHLREATERAWWIVPPLAILPRGRNWLAALPRGLVLFALSCVLLAGVPGGEPRYRPGMDSPRGFEGWAVIAGVSLFFAAADRYITSPRRFINRFRPTTRFLMTACVLLLGGAAVETVVYKLDVRRKTMQVELIVVDLLDALPKATVTAGAGGAAPKVDSILADRGEAETGGNQPALIVPVGASAEFEEDLPRQTSLSFSFAVDRNWIRPKSGAAQRVTFAVAIDGDEVLAQTLQPQDVATDCGWFERRIALTQRNERHARVKLSVRGEGADVEKLRAGFGRPLLVRREWRPRARLEGGRMNVVLVVIDSLRADHLGCYGYARTKSSPSPNIDRMAAESVLFEQAHAPSSWTWPSVASLFTGLWPPTHGVRDFDQCFLSDSLQTFAETLAANGCTTLGTTSNPLITKAKNFDQGFETWQEFPLWAAPRLGEEFCDWVRRYKAFQFFAYVHFVDPHRPYNPPEQFATTYASPDEAAAMRDAVNQLRIARAARKDRSRALGPTSEEEKAQPKLSPQAIVDLYDGEIVCVDHMIGRMRRALEDAGLLDRTIFVITSDHGEILAVGEPPPTGASLDPELLRVPLIIRDPRQPARRMAGVTDQTFLAATLLKALDIAPMPGGLPPVALPPWGPVAPRFAYAHTARGLVPGTTSRCELVSLENADWRFVKQVGGSWCELTDLRPPERRDKSSEKRQQMLSQRLDQWLELCRRDAVARPFERMDYVTEFALQEYDEAGTSH